MAFLAAVPAAEAQSDAPSRQHFVAGVDFSFVNTSGLPSWTEGFVGKLRHDDSSEGLMISRAFLDYDARLGDTVDFNATVEYYDDDLGPAADFTEAYVEWRPVPRSSNRYRLKVGAFYPRLSLENTGPGWSSPYTISSSTINTWVAEEIRTIGAELAWSNRPRSLDGKHEFGLQAALFQVNDPAGSLLAWKGWSAHDRQSRYGDELPLPPLPQIQPGMMFAAQDPYVAPFREIDGRTGYYVSGEWRMGRRFQLTAMHYDNRADPEGIEDNQFAWWTYFDHVAIQATLPGDVGLLAQWMDGFTAWGRLRDGIYSVDNEFRASYVLLTRAFDRHRITARYDDFEVTEADSTPLDENAENGYAWTLAYHFEATDNLSLAAEWLKIHTNRPAWLYFGLEQSQSERQFQLSLRFRFDHSW